jgi:hypothetical protein
MRALQCGFAAAAVLASVAAPAIATERTRTVHTFTCPSTNTTLRVIFDSRDDTATVTRIRQPNIKLDRAEPRGGDQFRYVRNNNRHELSGTMQRVRWRVGQAVWECPAGG